VLSTAIGAEGIDYPGLEIRETADEWFQAIRESFVRPPEVDGDASAYARTRYHWRRELTL
jgi:hypothetical protein